jgi:4'-phosphopantetheinyl transferase
MPGLQLWNHDCHVWRVRLAVDEPIEPASVWSLSSEERQRASAFHQARDRDRFIIRRMALRHLLGTYLSCTPAAISFRTGRHGKPELALPLNSDGLQFSCSHSGDLALLAITRHQKIGVDLEQHRPLPDALDLARSFFSPREFAALQQIPPALQTKAFFAGWTRKEAFVKALGLGLSFPLHRFSVSLSPDQPAQLLKLESDPGAVHRWTMQSLDVAPDYSATLVVAGKPTATTCRTFEFATPTPRSSF